MVNRHLVNRHLVDRHLFESNLFILSMGTTPSLLSLKFTIKHFWHHTFFSKWFCRFGMPLDLITDQGKEFCARLSDDLFKRLGTNHLTTSPHHPQCNSQAEVANKTIAKYLASFCDDSTLDWELYLAPLMFSYNTSIRLCCKYLTEQNTLAYLGVM